MKYLPLLFVALGVLLLNYEVQARVGRNAHAMYLEAAESAGGCKDKEFLTRLERQYTACKAPEEQFKELYKAYDSAKPGVCNPRPMAGVMQGWNMKAAFGKELTVGGGDASGCT